MVAYSFFKLFKNQLVLIVFLLVLSIEIFSQEDISTLLMKLDSAIENSNTYTHDREVRIENYRKNLRGVESFSISEYEINSKLYEEYKPYICDSAIHYQNKNIEIAIRLNDQAKEFESKLELAYLLGSVGLYNEAVDLLESIETEKLPGFMLVDYYNSYFKVYGELAFYTQDKRKSQEYWKIFNKNLALLKQNITPSDQLYLQLKEDSARNAHLFKVALKYNDQLLIKTSAGTPEHAFVTFRRALIYQWQGDRENQKYFLTLSAISDIQSAIKDQASLMMLTQLLYEEGDIDRAYKYIRFSWSTTMFYNAKLRSLQSSPLLSLIDKTYQAKIENQKTKLQKYLLLTSSLLFLLVIALLIIYRQIKRLSVAKKTLQLVNDNLNHLNEELNKLNEELNQVNQALFLTNNALTESNKIKELYIGRFIELCSIYINKIDDYRKKVHKKIKEGNITEAKLITQSHDIMDEEFEELYANFDNAFLQLFPDFIEKVNELLNDNDKFILKKNELLNPELRIIALMRLGIVDGSKISQFLRYSLTTVYNYRTKTKNRTFLQKEEFDFKITQIR